jgi:DNA-binding beta-propeller fold protein YncE
VLSLAIQAGGGLTLINGVPSLGTSGAGQPRGIAVDPTGDFVYVADSGNGTNGVVSVFAVGAGNVLTYVASYSTAATTRTTFDLALADNAASGALYLYATNGVINSASDFLVSTGVLSLQSSTGGLSGPEGIVSDPNGDFVYVANSATGQVFGYSVGAGGALSSIGAFNTENPANPASAPTFLAITD